MDASATLVAHAGGAWDASLNLYLAVSTRQIVATQQIDEWVYVVGQGSFNVTRYSLSDWARAPMPADAPVMECDDEIMAWELFRVLRDGCLLWQCGACDAWIFTSNRPRVGRLPCSSCGTGGVDFRNADRHVGEDD